MKKVLYLSIILLITIAFLVGCASIVSSSRYPVTISSQPEGAVILIVDGEGKNVYSGTTPTTVELNAGAGFFKGADYTVTFKKEGHTPHTAQIQRGVDGWYIAGNLVIGGLLGWLVIDPATGAMWTLKNLHVDLSSAGGASLDTKGIRIVTIDEVSRDMRSKLVRLNN